MAGAPFQCTVVAHANLRHYLPGAEERTRQAAEGPLTVRALRERLGIPESEVMLSVVDGESVRPDRIIEGDCTVEFFPTLSGG
ncbi:MAG: hypothetical protein A2X36_02995 [Elusimicrobia bacterium GWA2_69_24]|nr:MAG: hypothetical protein A2X36_02995 [Elusimicrobia bacterium GWA2_69_24]HBL17723.1 hypothetical protein [Elusimicrobiota bacterium]